MTETQRATTDDQDEEFGFSVTEWVMDLLMGKIKQRWPDWRCTETITAQTRPTRKPERLRGQKVEPLEVYGHHTPFTFDTDGKQWVIKTDTKIASHRVYGLMSAFFCLFFFIIGFPILENENNYGSFYAAALLALPAVYNIIKARLGGEDAWVVFDRSTGNVCFWRKNAKNSLTVPFEQVHCYWTPVFRRGLSHNFYFMPIVNLPNERHRWWQVYMGFPTQYSQAQYFWRVLTDFMDQTKPIPTVPGLYHHMRWLEKNNYTLQDITEGGKEIEEADFVEIEEEIEKELSDIEKRIELMMQAPNFNAETVIQFYKELPGFLLGNSIQLIATYIQRRIRYLKLDNLMDRGFRKHFTMAEYRRDLNKLIQFFGPIVNDIAASYNSKEESSYIKLDVLEET